MWCLLVLNKRLSFQTFLCIFKTAFLFAYVRFMLFMLVGYFLKSIKLPQCHHLLYYLTSLQYISIIRILFYHYNTLSLLQYISIIAILFHYCSIFISLHCFYVINIFFKSITTQIMIKTTKLLHGCMTQ